MFRELPAYDVSDASLIELGSAMIQELEAGDFDKRIEEEDEDENLSRLDNGELRLPAGYTYFGQFVDHDITFDPISSLSRQNDPNALTDFRTPRFDLDSLYGRGPSDQPYLYGTDAGSDELHLSLGLKVSSDATLAGPDLPRVATGRAITGDPRNDENLIVSQLQVAMIRFHNAVVDRVVAAQPAWAATDVFKRAQQIVRWHYQWVIVHDFLPRLVGQDVVDNILTPRSYLTSPSTPVSLVNKPDLRFFHWKEQPYMPLEFSVAAYRYGHTMVRPSYLINGTAQTDPPIPGVNRIRIFLQGGSERQSLNGFRPLPGEWGVDWSFFLDGVSNASGRPGLPQPSYKLDATLSNPLGELPTSTAAPESVSPDFAPSIAQSLAIRNLLRGKRLSLPGGEDVARAMGITPLTREQLFDGVRISEQAKDDLAGRTPLWFYILKEAETIGQSAQLGPVGGRIVAEVLIGLLVGDPLSYIRVNPQWTPELESRLAGTFTLSDLINVAVPAEAPPAGTGYPAGE